MKYKVTMERDYNKFCFMFDEMDQVGIFIDICARHQVPTGYKDDDKHETKFCIEIVKEGEDNGVEL